MQMSFLDPLGDWCDLGFLYLVWKPELPSQMSDPGVGHLRLGRRDGYDRCWNIHL